MRSCEYCEVYGERKTKLLTIKNFSFYKNNKLLNLNNKSIHEADYMRIIFEYQKTEKKNQAVFHHRSGHLSLCPIIIWSNIIKRILSYPESSFSSKINMIKLPDGSIKHLNNRSSNGNVPCRNSSRNNQTDWTLVQ